MLIDTDSEIFLFVFLTCYPLLLINNDYENVWLHVNICIDQFTLINVYFEIISLSTYWGSSSFLIYIYYRGISSIVRRCIEKETGQEFAVKIIDISGEKSDIYEADLTKKDTVREINILKMCKGHDNISKLTVYMLIIRWLDV